MRSARERTHVFHVQAQKFYEQCKRENKPCWLCGMPIDYSVKPNSTDNSYNLDHYYPVSKRPDLQNDPANFRPSHASCNRLRGNNDPRKPLGALSRRWA
jgi:hypothetical protein